MNLEDFESGIRQIWQRQPKLIVLLVIGFIIFIFVVLDARRHKQKHRRKHPKKF